MSTVQPSITTRIIIQALGVKLAECSVDGSLIRKWAFVHKRHSRQIHKPLKTFWNQRKQIIKTCARMRCKPTSNTQPTMTKNANVFKLKERNDIYVLQPIADHQSNNIFFTQLPLHWAPYIWKLLPNKSYLVRRLEQMKRRSFIGCNYDRSLQGNAYPTYRPCHNNGNPILKS